MKVVLAYTQGCQEIGTFDLPAIPQVGDTLHFPDNVETDEPANYKVQFVYWYMTDEPFVKIYVQEGQD